MSAAVWCATAAVARASSERRYALQDHAADARRDRHHVGVDLRVVGLDLEDRGRGRLAHPQPHHRLARSGTRFHDDESILILLRTQLKILNGITASDRHGDHDNSAPRPLISRTESAADLHALAATNGWTCL
jgi:hypothetical protein